MKGDATTHTTNKRYREAYDRIDWGKGKKVFHAVTEGVNVREPVPSAAQEKVLDPRRASH